MVKYCLAFLLSLGTLNAVDNNWREPDLNDPQHSQKFKEMRRRQNNEIIEKAAECLSRLQSNLLTQQELLKNSQPHMYLIKKELKIEGLFNEYSGFKNIVELGANQNREFDKKFLVSTVSINLNILNLINNKTNYQQLSNLINSALQRISDTKQFGNEPLMLGR